MNLENLLEYARKENLDNLYKLTDEEFSDMIDAVKEAYLIRTSWRMPNEDIFDNLIQAYKKIRDLEKKIDAEAIVSSSRGFLKNRKINGAK